MKRRQTTKVSLESDDDDDGFHDTKLEVIDIHKSGPPSRLDTNDQTLPALEARSGQSHAPNKYGLTLVEQYKDQELVYEKVPDPQISQIDQQSIVKVGFKRNLRTLIYQANVSQTANGISFDSNIDSGNLYRAYKMNSNTFDLIMQSDINSNGYTNWFNFEMQISEQAPETIVLNVVNFMKKNLLFNKGLQPVIFSRALNKERGTEWFRYGSNVTYTQNKILRKIGRYCFDYFLEQRIKVGQPSLIVVYAQTAQKTRHSCSCHELSLQLSLIGGFYLNSQASIIGEGVTQVSRTTKYKATHKSIIQAHHSSNQNVL